MKKGFSFFVAGTDTGVGKTLITGLLAAFFSEKGHTVITQKWVQTGSNYPAEDVLAHLAIMNRGQENIKMQKERVMPYVFKYPASPHLASRLSGKKIDPGKIIQAHKDLCKEYDVVIAEGAGGVMTPLSDKVLIMDIVAACGLPVIICAPNRLGAINHTLLTAGMLRKNGIKVMGVILNNMAPGVDRIVAAENPRIIGKFGVEVLGEVQYLGDIDRSGAHSKEWAVSFGETISRHKDEFKKTAMKVYRKARRGG
jgi:dethiobiotin synthetase